ncbi:glycosyl hydrolase family 61-domain-containing protein [Echria macrotheca]|uniref:lytic cellulose monooxygenase (C4-dehydrogenating) n=1 Tax=Echria macrotheca TaxID=438768 RepID=A0AAJ0FAI1_9PEZI|nr:glycosyl hydrolase family 61-domain-containing protein [Echria macrotheca]
MTRITPLLHLAAALLSIFFTFSAAHSNLAYIIIDGSLYHGFDPRPGQINRPDRVGWSTANPDAGFVGPANYSTPEIACHLSGTSTPAHAPVRAGERVHVQWNGWPYGHPGPVLSYIAPCERTTDGCGSVDKAELRWTKIDNSGPGFINETGGPPGRWSSHVMIAQNNSWSVHVPDGLKPGPYVLRHEAIALHFAKNRGGAQNYPLCINLWVEEPVSPPTGGTVAPFSLAGGVRAMELYKEDDPGILIDVFQTLTTYVVPGPTVAAGAMPVAYSMQAQSVSSRDGVPVRVQGTKTVPFVAKITAAEREFRG